VSLKIPPGFTGQRSRSREQIRDSDISAGTESTYAGRILSTPVGIVEKLSSAFGGLVGLQK
jgi:hypothetical protein